MRKDEAESKVYGNVCNASRREVERVKEDEMREHACN